MADKTLGEIHREISQLAVDARARAASTTPGTKAHTEHTSEATAYEAAARVVREAIF
jgi:hypothetical protein